MKIRTLLDEYYSERERYAFSLELDKTKENIRDLKVRYFDLLLRDLEGCGCTIYILVGRRLDGDQPLQSLEASFDRDRLEELKVEYINTFDSLYIEECTFV